MANQELVYDITKQPNLQPAQQAIYARVGDGGLKTVTVKLNANNYPYDLTGKHVNFEGVKADSTRIIDTSGGIVLDPQGGIFRYVFPAQTFTARGRFQQAFFKVMLGDKVDTTIDVVVDVSPNLVEFGINSESYLSEYEQLISELKDKQQTFLTDLGQKVDLSKTQLQNISDRLDNIKTQLATNDVVSKTEFNSKLKNVVFIKEG
ncbi:phage baseplate upper protein [Lactiplantibacillus plantarum]|uniref:phage baseplate upper protein n=1 Tax=Lactiplantibacillus plantarum TaxID=1590 RepID=UPI0018AD3A01|nr:phage baseplate upper protein [Lactiplantibacillus plantarum]WGF86025.1 phage baseplate upper protein [Lactiplantibacillus plantarum]WGG43350.1 phage baseplate upper protein [Lactiplantibacillus plantarum]